MGEVVHNASYILNADFWIGVLRADKVLGSKLSVKDFPRDGYHSAQIVGPVHYGDIDCEHQRINFIDTFDVNEQLYYDEIHSQLVKAFHHNSRQSVKRGVSAPCAMRKRLPRAWIPLLFHGYERQVFEELTVPSEVLQLCMQFHPGITIDVPIYSGKVRFMLLNREFSINTCILPLGNIIRLRDYNQEEEANSSDERVTWLDIIENGLGECDGIEDCTEDRVLRSPEHDLCSILAHAQGSVFWRIVRWMIREPFFKIDAGLVQAQQQDLAEWVTPDWFAQVANRAKFMRSLKHTLERDCRDIRDVQTMLRVMYEMRFTRLFARVLLRSQVVRYSLTRTLRSCCSEDLPLGAIKKVYTRLRC